MLWIGWNTCSCLLLLYAVKRIRMLSWSWWRPMVIALISGVCSIFPWQPLWVNSLLISATGVCLAYKWRGWVDAFWNGMTFVAAEGAILLLQQVAALLPGQSANDEAQVLLTTDGAWSFRMLSFKLYLWFGAAALIVLWLLKRMRKETLIRRRKEQFIGAGKIIWKNRPWFGAVFLDSGNRLCEPLSGKPAVIMEAESAKRCWRNYSFPRQVQGPLDQLADELLEMQPEQAINWRLIPYRTISPQPLGMLAFRADRIELEGRMIEAEWVALTSQELSPEQRFPVIYPLLIS